MGLKGKASHLREMLDVCERLADAVEKAGPVDLEYVKEAVGADEKTLKAAAGKLEADGVLEIKRGFWGDVMFVPKRRKHHGRDINDFMALLESNDFLSFRKAAAKLQVPEGVVAQWCKVLEADGTLEVRAGLIRGDKTHILKHRIAHDIRERKRKCKAIYTAADYLVRIAEAIGGVGLDEVAAALNISPEVCEEKAVKLGALVKLDYQYGIFGSPRLLPARKPERKLDNKLHGKVAETYRISARGVPATVSLVEVEGDAPPTYVVSPPEVGEGTKALLKSLRDGFEVYLSGPDQDIEKARPIALEVARRNFEVQDEDLHILSSMLLHDGLGLGDIEYLMHDDYVDEVCVSEGEVTAYHRRFGWVKTNITVGKENRLYWMMQSIKDESKEASETSILETQLPGGDKISAAPYPISTYGTTITIGKYARSPWTMTRYLGHDINALSLEMAAFLWTCTQYELNIMVCGPKGSGKTSMLNSLCCLIQPAQRVVTVEEHRQISLPKTMRWGWTSLTLAGSPPKWRDKMDLKDLVDVSLKMKPDRLVLGETKGRDEAHALFQSMLSHPTYSTAMADTAEDLKSLLLSEPVKLPPNAFAKIHVIVVLNRDRKTGRRRVSEITEVIPAFDGGEPMLNSLYRWNLGDEMHVKAADSIRVRDELRLHAGMSADDLRRDVQDKEAALKWMLANRVTDVESFGVAVEEYYKSRGRNQGRVRQHPALSAQKL